MLHILDGVAEFERSIIRERQRGGIAVAKGKGVYRGRKSALTVDQVKIIRGRAAAGERKATLAREFKISRETLYQALRPGYAAIR
jgi:DNA invertase Pin-like site-specific DNA recombinase